MSSDPPVFDREQFRYYITGIELQPPITDPNCEVSANLFVDDELVCSFPWLDNTKPSRWSRLFLWDGSPPFRVVLRLCRRLKGKERSFNYPSYQVSEVDEDQGEVTIVHPEVVWIATVKYLTPTVAEQQYSDELDKIKRIEGTYESLKSDQTVKYLFKIALQFAAIAAESLSESTSKLSVLIIMKTWELLEQQTQIDDTIQQLLHGLVHLRDVIEVLDQNSISTIATTLHQLREPLNNILTLLEHASVYIFNRLATIDPAHISHDETPPNSEYDIETYLYQLDSLQKAFHASWSPATAPPSAASCMDLTNVADDESPVISWDELQATLDEPTVKLADTYEILNLLRPTNPSGYNPARACLKGTREAVLNRVITWAQNRKNSESFMWISGQAGMGKTSVATSLCQYLDSIQALAGSFFCQHSDPNLSDPICLINNLVYEVASRCPPYAREVANAIRANRILCTAHLSIRYEGLVKEPLKRLKSLSVPVPLAIIVDALDECGDSESHTTALDLLYDMSQLVPWLKVIITARPEGDLLLHYRNCCSHEPIVHLQTYDAFEDIRTYVQDQLGEVSQKEHWPENGIVELCTMAEGVFLWAALAAKYIKKSTTPASSRLRQVVENRRSPVTDHFDVLYTRALNAAMNDHNDDTTEAYTRCIGAIIATLERQPLAMLDLQHLLTVADLIGEGTLERVVTNISPLVLVRDGQYIKFHHSSFKHFAIDPSRSRNFHIQLKQHEANLAKCCLAVMQHDLRFNICELETSHLPNNEVPDLKRRIHSCIGPALKYACTHWIEFFVASPNQAPVEAIRKLMEGPQFMYWIEVLSLLGRIDEAIEGLGRVASLEFADPMDGRLMIFWAKDAWRFLLSFYEVVATSAPHLYISALAFAPTESSIARRMRPYFPNIITIVRGADATWHPCIKTIFHPHTIQSLSISPDGLRVIVGYPDGSLCIWDEKTGARVSEKLTGHTDSVTCVMFSPNGNLAASGSNDATIRVWEGVRGVEITSSMLAGHSGSVNSVAFSPNSTMIASGSSDKTVRLWDVKNLRSLGGPYVGHSSRVSSLAFSPDGTKLASGSWDQTIRVWSVDPDSLKLANNPLRITGHSDSVTCVAFSPDGSNIASGSVDKTIQIWDCQTGSKIKSHNSLLKHSDSITTVAFSPNGNLMASSSLDGAIRLWSAANFRESYQPFGHFNGVNVVDFSPDGAYIVSGSADTTTRVWELSTCPKIMAPGPLVGHSSYITSIAVSSDGTRIISGSYDATVRMWDAQTGSPIGNPFTGHSGYVSCVAISPDGTRVISGSSDGTMNLWDTATQATISTSKLQYGIHRALFSPDGTLIAYALTSGDNHVYFCDSTACQISGNALQGHSSLVQSFVFSPDGAYIASASADRTVILWNTGTRNRQGKTLTHKSGVELVAFSPCGTQLVSSSGGKVQLWDIKTGKVVLQLSGNSSSIMNLSFSLGAYIASVLSDNTIQLWDTTTGHAIGQPITGPSGSAQTVSFSPDGGHVLFGFNGSIQIQSLDISNSTDAKATGPAGTMRWPSNPHQLASHPSLPGWVTHDQKSLVFWLPPQYQQPAQLWATHAQVPHPQTFLDYSRFIHGTGWTGVARKS